jgi:hypothetical protein
MIAVRGATPARDSRGQTVISRVVFCAGRCGGDGLMGWLVYFFGGRALEGADG